LWKKIFPQKNGVPVYNPHGRYWVKLHHMGKPRKIEIDDTIPCNKNEEPIIPRCESWEELWPAIITKAIIKLFSYKFKTYIKPESIIGDIQIIHALTGYFAEIIDLKNPEIELKQYLDKINHTITENDSNSNLINSGPGNSHTIKDKFFVMCYNFKKESNELKEKKKENKLSNDAKTNLNLPNIAPTKEKEKIENVEDLKSMDQCIIKFYL